MKATVILVTRPGRPPGTVRPPKLSQGYSLLPFVPRVGLLGLPLVAGRMLSTDSLYCGGWGTVRVGEEHHDQLAPVRR